ncbi:MAG: hypothetical protein WBX15_05330 [Thermoanaerobaculia bacterium]
MKRLVMLILAATLGSSVVYAQELSYQKILLPLRPRGVVNGAYGSQWRTSLIVLNRSGEPVMIVPPLSGCQILCPPEGEGPPTLPGVSFNPYIFTLPDTLSGEGFFVYVDRAHAADVAFQLNTRDLSREAETRGTEVPVVREGEFFTGTRSLLGIPVDARFRVSLRIYDGDNSDADASATVRFFEEYGAQVDSGEPDRLLLEETIPFQYPTSAESRRAQPGYIYLPDLAMIPELAGISTIRIDVESAQSGRHLWTFASVTNNQTQHVTLITPQ